MIVRRDILFHQAMRITSRDAPTMYPQLMRLQEDIGLAAEAILRAENGPCVVFDEIPGCPKRPDPFNAGVHKGIDDVGDEVEPVCPFLRAQRWCSRAM